MEAKIEKRFKTKVITVDPNSIVVIKQPSDLTDEQMDSFLQGFADEIVGRLDYSSIVIGVKSLADIQQLDEERMNYYGWYRNEQLDAVRDTILGTKEEE